MSFGLEVFNAAGALRFDTTAAMGRIVGYGSLSWTAADNSAKTVTFPGLLSTDSVLTQHTTAHQLVAFTVSVSGTVVTVNKTGSAGGSSLDILVIAVRMQ